MEWKKSLLFLLDLKRYWNLFGLKDFLKIFTYFLRVSFRVSSIVNFVCVPLRLGEGTPAKSLKSKLLRFIILSANFVRIELSKCGNLFPMSAVINTAKQPPDAIAQLRAQRQPTLQTIKLQLKKLHKLLHFSQSSRL